MSFVSPSASSLYRPGRFDGELGEITIYHTVILDTQSFVRLLQKSRPDFRGLIRLQAHESDAACDWCITEAVHRAFPELLVVNHELNDRYEAVYDAFFFGEEHVMRRRLLPYLQMKKAIKVLKVMPLLDKTFIAIGT